MFKYKPEEGVLARGAAFWALAGFAFLAARRFYLWAQRWEFTRKDLLGSEIPVLALSVTPGLLIATAIGLAATWGVFRLLNLPKFADFFIDTELEMKKVTWPSLEEARGASIVVICCVIVLVAFLTVADLGLEKVFFGLIYGGGNGQ